MASIRFVALLLALFCIFLMQQGVQSGLVKRDSPNEPSALEKLQEEIAKGFETLKTKTSEAVASLNTDEFQKGLKSINDQFQDLGEKVSKQFQEVASNMQKKD